MFNAKSKELKQKILDIGYKTGKGHLGGTFSVLDILVSLYYSDTLTFDYSDLKSPLRDIVLVGKGHACLATYCILADKGAIDWSLLDEFGVNGGKLGTQFDISFDGAESNTGSLGHVVGIAAGYGLSFKLSKSNRRAYAIIGDGECDEGSIWESMDFAVKNKLDNVTVIVDKNNLSVTSQTENSDELVQKFIAFGAEVRVVDGHNYSELLEAWKFSSLKSDRPAVIIANTVKGNGVSFMENNPKWHQSAMTESEYEQAKGELS